MGILPAATVVDDVSIVQCLAHRRLDVHVGRIRVRRGIHEDDVPRALAVLLLTHADGHRRAVVGTALHLLDIPVGIEETQVHDAHIRPVSLHFLHVPEREGVVVTIGEEDGIGREAVEVILGHVHAGAAAGTAVVIPSFRSHLQGNEEQQA